MEENASGIIINTSGFSGGSSLDIMRTVIDAFHADVIVIIGHERLAAQLRTIPELKDKHIVKLHKSPGVVIRDSKFRSRLQKRMFKNYFYGPDSELTPRQVVIGFNGIGFYEVGGSKSLVTFILYVRTAFLLLLNFCSSTGSKFYSAYR